MHIVKKIFYYVKKFFTFIFFVIINELSNPVVKRNYFTSRNFIKNKVEIIC